MSAYDLIAQAIENKQQITAVYRGHYREMSPHTLGMKNGRRQALFFQFAGTSSSGLPPGGEWRCIVVDALQDVQIREGDWHSGTRHSQPQTCIDIVEYEVKY